MKIHNLADVPGQPMGKDIPGVTKRVLVGKAEGAENFVIRHFTLEPGAVTPHHAHEAEHEVFVLEGTGALVGEKGEKPLKAMDAAFVAPNEVHHFHNTGRGKFSFLCVVPMSAEK